MKSFFNFLLQFSSFFSSSFFSVFLSFRPLNLFLIVLTQTLTSVFLLKDSLCISNLFTKNYTVYCLDFCFLVLATVLSAAGGYILNDVFDRKIDLINSPKRGFFTKNNLSLFYFLSSLFFILALLFGFVISLQIGICVLSSSILLIFYAKYSKKIGIFKPILVSFLTAFSIVLVGFGKFAFFSSIPSIIWIFSIWAFLLSMCREIIKDFEDLEGDNFQNSFTSVIQLGITKSILFLNFLSTLLILSILLSIYISTNTLYTSLHKILMIILVGIFIFLLNKRYHGCFCMKHFVCLFAHKRTYHFLRSVILGFNHASEEAIKFSSEELNTHEQLTVITFNNSNSTDYKKMSLFCKIMMLVGILGMIFY